MTYQVLDLEVENNDWCGRFASPFCKDNWVVAYGWKHRGDTRNSWCYVPTPDAEHTYSIPEDVDLMIGHNFRFDLQWIWNRPDFQDFIRRGGRVWCTQYAEYLLEGQDPDYQMNRLEDLAVKYGGTKKIDEVKALWESGKKTSEIPEHLLIDYLVGTEDEKRSAGDIGNTELVYLAQLKRAKEEGMFDIIQARMDGYLATLEMEMNGVYVNMQTAMEDMAKLREECAGLVEKLKTKLPEDFPEKAEFNFNSSSQLSAFLFGGFVEYKWSDHYVDENTGELARTQVDVPHLYVDGEKRPVDEMSPEEILNADKYLSGKRKGQLKSCKVKLPVGELKKRVETKVVQFPQRLKPLAEWKGSRVDAVGRPVYSTASDVFDALEHHKNEAVKLLARYKKLTKNLGAFYLTEDEKSDKVTGMLTFVRPDTSTINHHINHTSTITGRNSCKNPNLQQVPRPTTAPVKRMFESRYKGGMMGEVDYSQLEVVVQGYLTGDENLIRDLRAGVDFHVKRVAFKHHKPYEEVYPMCKDESHPDYAFWSAERTSCKVYSFQSQYGAGASKIAVSSGMDVEEVKSIMEREAAEYAKAAQYHVDVENHLKKTAVPHKVEFAHGGHMYVKRAYWRTPTGTRYSWRSERAPKWLQDRGVDQSFKPTQIKNYPTQGTGGEIMQVMLGVLFRKMVARGWWSAEANKGKEVPLLVNTVHDCVWGDSPEQYAAEAFKFIASVLGDVKNTYQEKFGIDTIVDFPVDAEMGKNMCEMHHIEN